LNRLRQLRQLGHAGRSEGQSIVEFALILPLMLILLLAIVDFARIYTTMMSVESAAREAADFGTALGAGKWSLAGDPPTPADNTLALMRQRACVAARNLPDYVGAADGSSCTNPAFSYCMTPADGAACEEAEDLPDPAACADPEREVPCTVTVTLTYDFRLLAPVNIELMGASYGFPSTITFTRDSTFAMTDIGVMDTTP
jgi:hypothetical protein